MQRQRPRRFQYQVRAHVIDPGTFPVPTDEETPFLAWSEPVRFEVIHPSLIASGGLWHPQPNPQVNAWYMAWSEPVREKRGLRAPYHPFLAMDTEFVPRANTFVGWFNPFSEPIRLKKGLGAPYHQPFFYPPRMLPTPNVFLVLDATETNNDQALFGLNIPGSGSGAGLSGARVSIVELPAANQAGMSIREP